MTSLSDDYQADVIEAFKQIVGIPMGTNCVPFVTDLFSFCYERDSMSSLSTIIKLIF